jgi:hypothetical protein
MQEMREKIASLVENPHAHSIRCAERHNQTMTAAVLGEKAGA